ncbi:protein phosphatase 1H-like isoform X1 [Portunus trituberculatus]|uniref:Protein phosphatase 1H n=1 Tax=Portunus trituberculatus TaxID=210409 RepID=A0A5B7F1J2_PORTR|nr:protein phosphatase 1H-like isoform X1 [Portunus trituberculatus]XP_045117489.1 protein phosphatase 1H-like isoform X1 [Portunus trituberculatus]MPC39216.1 Protein phosphatase 1H [Portunus trituberculatus]
MLNRFKTALYNVVGSFDQTEGGALGGLGPGVTSGLSTSSLSTRSLTGSTKDKGLRFPYTRPHFLQLGSEDEIQVTADHAIRPIICPRDISRLPWNSGYAETINAGKSKKNEDQAVVHVGLLTRPLRVEQGAPSSTSSSSSSPSTLQDARSSSIKAEPVVNGHSEEGSDQPQEKTVMLQPQGIKHPLSASPATELKEGFSQDLSSNPEDQPGEGPGGIKIEEGSAEPPPPHESPQQSPMVHVSLPYYIFGVFDGHAGWGAAVAAANQLHHLVHEKLCDVIDILIPDPLEEKQQTPIWAPEKEVTMESAVTGALENAFWQMDHTIAEDRLRFQLTGGCTACVALFIHGKLFLANAGDSRAILSMGGVPLPMSFDFTPETENQRIRKLGAMHPELLGGEFTHLDFVRRPQRRDLGKRVLYREHYMSGWAYKTLTPDDLKYPLVCGEGKRSRVLGTIGVTRGFGDHDLKAQCTSIPIKPFLSPEPEVRVFDVEAAELTDGDVLVLATDGLWDIISNERAVAMVGKSLSHFPPDHHDKHKYRYTSAAQDLVMGSRGKLKERYWRTGDDKHATIDDITVFVVPILPYQEEHRVWKARQGRPPKGKQAATKERIETSGNGHAPAYVPPREQDNHECSSTEKHNTQDPLSTWEPPSMENFDLHPQEDHFRSEMDTAQTQRSEEPLRDSDKA